MSPARTVQWRRSNEAQTEEIVVAGKTPQKPASKKVGKSLKEKREAKREKKAGK